MWARTEFIAAPLTRWLRRTLQVPAVRVLLLAGLHAAIFLVAGVGAWLVGLDFVVPGELEPNVVASLPFIVSVQLLLGAFCGFYRGWWRYVGIVDVMRLVAGTVGMLLVLLAIWSASPANAPLHVMVAPPRSVLLV